VTDRRGKHRTAHRHDSCRLLLRRRPRPPPSSGRRFAVRHSGFRFVRPQAPIACHVRVQGAAAVVRNRRRRSPCNASAPVANGTRWTTRCIAATGCRPPGGSIASWTHEAFRQQS